VFGDDLIEAGWQAGSLPYDGDSAGIAIGGVEPIAVRGQLQSDRPPELSGEVVAVGGGNYGKNDEKA